MFACQETDSQNIEMLAWANSSEILINDKPYVNYTFQGTRWIIIPGKYLSFNREGEQDNLDFQLKWNINGMWSGWYCANSGMLAADGLPNDVAKNWKRIIFQLG